VEISVDQCSLQRRGTWAAKSLPGRLVLVYPVFGPSPPRSSSLLLVHESAEVGALVGRKWANERHRRVGINVQLFSSPRAGPQRCHRRGCCLALGGARPFSALSPWWRSPLARDPRTGSQDAGGRRPARPVVAYPDPCCLTLHPVCSFAHHRVRLSSRTALTRQAGSKMPGFSAARCAAALPHRGGDLARELHLFSAENGWALVANLDSRVQRMLTGVP
jgi:hypothetical protein